MEFICTCIILMLFAGFTFICIKHYNYCAKIQYLEDNGYVKHKHTIGYDGRYILYFTKGVTKVDEEELFKLTLKELKEKYK